MIALNEKDLIFMFIQVEFRFDNFCVSRPLFRDNVKMLFKRLKTQNSATSKLRPTPTSKLHRVRPGGPAKSVMINFFEIPGLFLRVDQYINDIALLNLKNKVTTN